MYICVGNALYPADREHFFSFFIKINKNIPTFKMTNIADRTVILIEFQ